METKTITFCRYFIAYWKGKQTSEVYKKSLVKPDAEWNEYNFYGMWWWTLV